MTQLLCHTSRVTKKFVDHHKICILPDWPPQSTDLNIIENLWQVLKENAHKNRIVRSSKPENEEQLLVAIDGFQNVVLEENCQNYYRHVINNILSCIEGKCIYNE